jgi:mannose-6-phosphate isomerase-like protein (cupin superfamily)
MKTNSELNSGGAAMDGLDHLRDHLFAIWRGRSAIDGITPNGLWQFTPPPDDLIRQDIAPNPAAAATHLANWRDGLDSRTAPLHQAVLGARDLVHWQFAYKTSELENRFFDHYAFFELIGPTGHFRSHQCNVYFGYWGPHLFYPAHHHEAEEKYFVISGKAIFAAEGATPKELGPTDETFHASWQPHWMTTGTKAVLTLILWRGAGLGDGPILCAK